MKKTKTNPVKILDVIYLEDTKGRDIDTSPFDIYKLNGDGTASLSSGIKIYNDEVLFYDVTLASEEFKEQHGDIIDTLCLKDKIRKRKKDVNSSRLGRRIISLLPLSSDQFCSLKPKEKRQIGSDYCTLVETPSGFVIRECLVVRGKLPECDLYAKVSPMALDEDLQEKISNSLVELQELEPGLYWESGFIAAKGKSLDLKSLPKR